MSPFSELSYQKNQNRGQPDQFMQILRLHGRDGYLQHYESHETLLNDTYAHPASDPVQADQYEMECAALTDCNFNVPCRYPSRLTILKCRMIESQISVIFQ